MQQQVSGFKIGALFGEIFDRIAAIAEDAGIAVDVGHLADARRGVVEGRIVAHHAEIGWVHLDLAQVHGPNRVVLDGEFVGLAGAVVGDSECLARRGRSLGLSRLRRGSGRGVHKPILEGERGASLASYLLYTKGRRS